jgi:ParB family chromosome partitioning protein
MKTGRKRVLDLRVADIRPNPHQPRRIFEEAGLRELAESVAAHGILQPLTVRRIYESDGTTISNSSTEKTVSYQLIAGERRLRAAIAIGMETVPCIILDADNRRAAELALIENLQRENLNMFEQAGAIAALIDMHAMTQEEIARTLSVSQSCIANKLRLLRLTSEERDTILCAHLTERHARAFLRIKDL